ncbi:hypothetical protein SAY87_009495 [Trapa incisa]|uniref:Uncharacterized protein n=1 Tax=Trapa incisa TaxID=236973 RepID=A0AAN7K1T1_9MYRT|nr:hypothetical protein SAY87_009495 [Trapa incisa]
MEMVLCLGQQSMLQNAEPSNAPVTLRLRLSSPPELADHLSCTNNAQEWSTMVADGDHQRSDARHLPWLKLSHRSLQLCTENLGCETGSEIAGGVDSIFSHVGIFRASWKAVPDSIFRVSATRGQEDKFTHTEE